MNILHTKSVRRKVIRRAGLCTAAIFSALLFLYTILMTVDNDNQLFAETLLQTNLGSDLFNPATPLLNGTYPLNDAELGDFDGDGDLDLLIVNDVDPKLIIYKNNDGELNEILDWNPQFLGRPSDAAWGDADGDGDLDLAVAIRGNRPHLIFRNDGGVLTATDPLLIIEGGGEVVINAHAVAWGDFNGDGLLDLMFGHGSKSWIKTNQSKVLTQKNYIYSNESQGDTINFSLAFTSANHYPTKDIAIADFDGDSDLDIVVANSGFDGAQPSDISGTINTLYINQQVQGGQFNTSTIDFVEQPITLTNGITYEMPSVAVAWENFDADPFPDLFIGNSAAPDEIFCNRPGTSGERILEPCWATDQQTQTQDLSFIATFDATTADVNQDGAIDLILGTAKDPNYILCGTSGAITPIFDICWDSTQSEVNLLTKRMLVGDINGNGRIDIIEANGSDVSQPTYVYYNSDALLVENPGIKTGPNQTVSSSTLGDIDQDGDLDLVVGYETNSTNPFPIRIYINNSGMFSELLSVPSTVITQVKSVALGDYDQDGKLDLAIGGLDPGNHSLGALYIYRNTTPSAQIAFENFWSIEGISRTHSVAWGDMNGDGYLDLAIGTQGNQVDSENQFDGGFNEVYTFNSVQSEFEAAWRSAEPRETEQVAWGDTDNDGDLDLIVANQNQPNELYLNQGGILSEEPIWQTSFINRRFSTDLALGDINQDGLLDVVFANGTQNNPQISELFLNQGGTFGQTPDWSSEPNTSVALALKDIDSDGDLDLAISNSSLDGNLVSNDLYLNQGQMFESTSTDWQTFKLETFNSRSKSLLGGDIDLDGDIDLLDMFAGQFTLENDRIVLNSRVISPSQPMEPVLRIIQSGTADFYGLGQIVTDELNIPFVMTGGHPVQQFDLKVQYSLNGIGKWVTLDKGSYELSVPAPLTPTTCSSSCNLTINLLENGIVGRTDNFVVRLQAVPYVGTGGIISYPNQTPMAQRFNSTTATSYPYRIQGRSIQVMNAGGVVSGAIVFRQPNGSDIFDPYVNELGFSTTDLNGNLQAIDQLNPGDSLFALWPVAGAPFSAARKFHTSHPPSQEGIHSYLVSPNQTQLLTVSENNPFYLFDLTISLEWDASDEPVYLAQLEQNIKQSSAILYDLTDGQMALGDVTIYQNKEFWHEAHVTIFASNRLRPNADLVGVVSAPISLSLGTNSPETSTLSFTNAQSEIYGNQTITHAIVPGQVRMPALWNRYGNPGTDGGDDWARAFAHELSHYLLFLPDNYLQVNPNNGYVLDASQTDCSQSYMTDAYLSIDRAEFLHAGDWVGSGCADTIAQFLTGFADWDLIEAIYGISNKPETGVGPRQLPLNITTIKVQAASGDSNLVSNQNFSLVDENNTAVNLSLFNTQAFIIRSNEITPGNTFTEVIGLGVPVANQLLARGAQIGDEICVYNNTPSNPQVGCIMVEENGSGRIQLQTADSALISATVDIDARAETISRVVPYSETIALSITVTLPPLPNASIENVKVELFPIYSAFTTSIPYDLKIEALSCQSGTNNEYTCSSIQPITLPDIAYSGYLKLWTDNPNNHVLRSFNLAGGYGPNRIGYGPNRIGYGPNRIGYGPNRIGYGPNRIGYGPNRIGYGAGQTAAWNAPVTSGDGQLFLFNAAHTFGSPPPFVLQGLQAPPDLPIWLTAIGNAYDIRLFEGTENSSIVTTSTSIAFNYLQRDVPGLVNETELQIYFKGRLDSEWRPLATTINPSINLAAAATVGDGVYALLTTIEGIPLQSQQWNRLVYPRIESQPINQALGSIEGSYSTVYYLDQSLGGSEWLLYDPAITSELKEFVNDLTHLEPLQDYLIYATADSQPYFPIPIADTSNTIFDEPPATFYGWITPTTGFTPTTDSTLYALVGDQICGQGLITGAFGINQLAFKIQVASNDSQSGCGSLERTVHFVLDGQRLPATVRWNNQAACYLPLAGSVSPTAPCSSNDSQNIYLPMVTNKLGN